MNITDSKHNPIVTNGEYVRAQGKRAGLRGWGILMLVHGFFFAVLDMLMIVMLGLDSQTSLSATLPFLILCTVAAWFLIRRGSANLDRAAQIRPGIPLSRVNTAHLPAANSLVRAAQEPAGIQQDILLRAAGEQNTPAEQLVRPSGIQE